MFPIDIKSKYMNLKEFFQFRRRWNERKSMQNWVHNFIMLKKFPFWTEICIIQTVSNYICLLFHWVNRTISLTLHSLRLFDYHLFDNVKRLEKNCIFISIDFYISRTIQNSTEWLVVEGKGDSFIISFHYLKT